MAPPGGFEPTPRPSENPTRNDPLSAYPEPTQVSKGEKPKVCGRKVR